MSFLNGKLLHRSKQAFSSEAVYVVFHRSKQTSLNFKIFFYKKKVQIFEIVRTFVHITNFPWIMNRDFSCSFFYWIKLSFLFSELDISSLLRTSFHFSVHVRGMRGLCAPWIFVCGREVFCVLNSLIGNHNTLYWAKLVYWFPFLCKKVSHQMMEVWAVQKIRMIFVCIVESSLRTNAPLPKNSLETIIH